MPSLLNTVRDLDRLRQIVGVLARHGFGEVVQRTGLGSLLGSRAAAAQVPRMAVGERIRLVLQDLGPSFIKLGQILSTRPDLVPEDILRELKKLQDEVPPEPFETVRAQIEGELGATIAEVFEAFDETPLASASIAQVHRARLRRPDGSLEVVAKVQRPRVKDTIERDVDLLYWLAHAMERSIPESRLYSPVKLVSEFDRAVTAELDFTLEADNAERFAANFRDSPRTKFPTVYREASSKRVLTLEYLPGKKVHEAVADGASGEVIAKLAIEILLKQVFEDGFFHADPHPGNVFIMGTTEEPVIAMIDLGLVGRLSPQMRDRTIDLMVAAVREDYRGIADALYAIGRPTEKIDREAYEAEVAVLAQKYLGKSLREIDFGGMLRDLVYGAKKYGIEVPSDFLLLGKALMTVEGVGKEIYPELDVLAEVRPYFLKLIAERYSPERVGHDVMRGVIKLSAAAAEMPVQMQEILEDLRKGAFRLQVRETDLKQATDRLGRRIYSGMIVSALILSGGLLLATDQTVPGALAFASAAAWGGAHWTWLLWLNRVQRNKP